MTSLTAAGAQPAQKPKLLDRLRDAIRVRHYSIRTEDAYVQWVRRFIFFPNKRHPDELGCAEVEAFLTHLAMEGRVAAATQNQALDALVFLYRSRCGAVGTKGPCDGAACCAAGPNYDPTASPVFF